VNGGLFRMDVEVVWLVGDGMILRHTSH